MSNEEAIRNIKELLANHKANYDSLPVNAFILRNIELARMNTLRELKTRLERRVID